MNDVRKLKLSETNRKNPRVICRLVGGGSDDLSYGYLFLKVGNLILDGKVVLRHVKLFECDVQFLV